MKHLPIEQDIEQPDIEYDADGIPKHHNGTEVRFKFNLCEVWNWYRNHKRVVTDYDWVYECGICKAPKGAASDPYCKEHGLALVRKPKQSNKKEV